MGNANNWFDDIARILASPISRRQAIQIIASGIAGAALNSVVPGRVARAQIHGQACGEKCTKGLPCATGLTCFERPIGGTCCSELCGPLGINCCCPGEECCDSTCKKKKFCSDGKTPCKCGDCSNCPTKPAITLVSFSALPDTGSRVRLAWETGSEVDNAGFNLYRASSAGGPYAKINQALIAAGGDPVSGASYSFTDAPGNGTFFYKLEDVDVHDGSTLHGPVTAHIGPEGASSGNGNSLFLPFAEK